MYSLTVRKLLIDLESGFGRHWAGGDAFLTQYHNALSLSFPVGEQSFIDAVRDGVKLLPDEPQYAELRAAAAQFIGQEATHRHLHGLYNAELERQGLVNVWGPSASVNLEKFHAITQNPLHFLAMTAAFEHFTAVFADVILRNPAILKNAEPKMRMLWEWHASEETEHSAIAFDLYKALGGNYKWRMRWYYIALLRFTVEAAKQTIDNLRRDRTLFKPSTWWGAAKFMLGRHGMLWLTAVPLMRYLKPSFHPSQDAHKPTAQDLAASWLRGHQNNFRAVR